jgi:ABC-2 type transport system ATP-binding protein
MKCLQIHNLRKSFRRDVFARKVEILKGVEFSLDAGSITAFLGGNGAGKTTTIKCALSLLFPDAGEILFFDNQPFTQEVKARIGFLPERTYFYEYLTGLEFLRFYGELAQKFTARDVKTRAEALIKRVGLESAADRRLRFYSKGMLQKIGIAQALIHEPELLILDEPMSGLDPDGRVAVSEIISEAAKAGAAVFFSSHLINDAEKICDRVVMLRDGQTLFEGDIEKLLAESQRGFQLRTVKGTQHHVKKIGNEVDLQLQLQKSMSAGEHVVEVAPIRLTLEEIFVSKVLRGENEAGAPP